MNTEEALTQLHSEIEIALKSGEWSHLKKLLASCTPPRLASTLSSFPVRDQIVIFRVLPRGLAAECFEFLPVPNQEELLRAMGQSEATEILNEMAPDDRTTLLEELPAAVTKQMLSLLSPEERLVANRLLGYPENSIGRLMTPMYVAVYETWTVKEVLDYVREHGSDSETLTMIYVINDKGRLIDDIRIREFLLAPLTKKVSELMDYRYVFLNATDSQTSAVSVFQAGDRKALPVIDSEGILIGIVTIDDILEVSEAAATQEIQRVGGSEALDEPYMKMALLKMVKKRAGWLVILFVGEMLTATAMGFYENEIARAVVLALFVPLIISSGGNSGSQATTLVIRALALGEVKLRDWWRVMRREIMTGFALGGILGLIGFLRISLWTLFSPIYGPHWLLVALTVGISLVGIVLWGSVAGSMLPFILRRIGFDPATASAPFVATLVDVTGLVIYFSVGSLFLRGTLL